jgi:predicted dehydrogenase/threonine dehydrogenase-like Zn-dependent dehydrogenase
VKQIVQSARTGKLALVEVPAPVVRPGHLLVRTSASLISPGTERMVVEFARKSLVGKAQARPDLVQKVIGKLRRDGAAATLRAVLARLDEPLPLGYSAAGTVEGIGSGLEGEFRVGDRVAMAGAGLANHAEINVVPRNLVARIPDGVTDEEAAFGTLSAIALHGVRNLGLGLGDVAVVIGVGLVGQIATQLLTLSGVRVVAIDTQGDRLDLARRSGAEGGYSPGAEALGAVAALTSGRGADGVLVAAAADSREPLELAGSVARDRARVILLGKVGTEFPYADFMKKEISLLVSRSYGPGRYDDEFELAGLKYPVGWIRWTETDNLAESLRLMQPSRAWRLDVKGLISHRFALESAEAAYSLVVDRVEPSLGVVLQFPPAKAIPASTARVPRVRRSGHLRLGVIGAGNFTRTVLLPELKRIPGVELQALVTARGFTAENCRKLFGFVTAGTEVGALAEDPDIDAVIVATPHASHAGLAARFLAAGKSVFVEKPLAIDRDGLNQVITALNQSSGVLGVGFNRRYAPMMVEARAHLAQCPGPKMLFLRVNAGPRPEGGWLADAAQGGRIVGEACHFVDLAKFLIGARTTTVQAMAATGGAGIADDVSIAIGYADGSVATIVYTGQGDAIAPKERVEAYAAGSVLVMEDFSVMTITSAGRTTRRKAGLTRDKGHRAQLEAFVAAVVSGGPAPCAEAELIETSLATIAVLESLASGRRVDL